ncbi:hypothetical protein ACFFX1_26700 [Dactylosporangium sucinum]|uniref:Uncharacterized protein n=1 Tax=Dactylosporangium sucinum TaxID=1424081 RepID=A0A917T1J5_9ACTN|nr:hypothetical protein [Dactylosporangium sucinum]GGM05728.1 hypothetical protein GCM10007977_003570 [Dactylosporangium sucinum]
MRRRTALEFTGTQQAIGGITLGSEPAGVILGFDQHQSPVTLQLFRPRPTRVLLIDRGWVERLLMLRAMAVGARVVVNTPDPAMWAGFGESVTGRPDLFHVAPAYQAVELPSSVAAPVLFVAERHPLSIPALGPWQALVTVAGWLGEYVQQSLLEADVVILRRLTERQLAAAAALMRLDALQAATLQATPPDGLVVYQEGEWRYLRMAITQVEHGLFGAPQ